MESYSCYASVINSVNSCLFSLLTPLKAIAFTGFVALATTIKKIKLHTTTRSGYMKAQISPALGRLKIKYYSRVNNKLAYKCTYTGIHLYAGTLRWLRIW